MGVLANHGDQLLMLATAFAVFAAFTLLIVQTPTLGLYLIATFIVVAWTYPVSPVLAQIGGTSVYPEDVLTAALALAALVRAQHIEKAIPKQVALWLVVLAFITFSLIRGVETYGQATAVNEARATIYLFVGAGWMLGHLDDERFRHRFDSICTLLAGALAVVFALHVVRHGLGGPDTFVPAGSTMQTSRPLTSGQAVVLAMIGLRRYTQGRRFPAVAFLGVAMLCQHRSVWIAVVAGLLVLFLVNNAQLRRRLVPTLVVAPILVLCAVWSGMLGDLPGKIIHDATNLGTFNGRTFAWSQLVAAQDALGLHAVILGQPFGGGFTRVNADGFIETFAPHNWYVVLYLRLGLISVVLVAALLLGALRRAIQCRDATATAWAATLIVYCLPYNLPWYVAPFLAVALAARPVPLVEEPDERPTTVGQPREPLRSGLRST